MASQKKKGRKQTWNEQGTLVEGISRRIKRDLEDIIEDLDSDQKRRNQATKDMYSKLCQEIDQLSIITNNCYNLYIGDNYPLTINSRNPLVLLNYSRLFLIGILDIKKRDIQERDNRRRESDISTSSLNQNNIYELVAKKNIEFLEVQTQIKEFQQMISLATKRAIAAEEMTEAIKSQSEVMLKVYRDNFAKITDLLQKAEQKETELLQSNRFLNEEIQNINIEYDNYKKNFKTKPLARDAERKLKERFELEYEQKLKMALRQMEKRQLRG